MPGIGQLLLQHFLTAGEQKTQRELQLAQIANLKAEEELRRQQIAEKVKEMGLGEKIAIPERPETEELRPETEFKPEFIPEAFKPHPLAIPGMKYKGVVPGTEEEAYTPPPEGSVPTWIVPKREAITSGELKGLGLTGVYTPREVMKYKGITIPGTEIKAETKEVNGVLYEKKGGEWVAQTEAKPETKEVGGVLYEKRDGEWVAVTEAKVEHTTVDGRLWEKQTDGKWIAVTPEKADKYQKEGVTDKGFSISFDPSKGIFMAASPEGIVPYNTQTHGRISKEVTVSELKKLIDERNLLPPGDPSRKLYDAKIKKLTESTGTKISVDKDGNIEILEGQISALSKPSIHEAEKKIITATDAEKRLRDIKAMYRPEFQTLRTRWTTEALKLAEKAGRQLPPADKQLLADYSVFKRRTWNHLNLYIKEITGAQMTIQEADRILKGMPNPGKGLFDGDAPTEFESKLNDALLELEATRLRYMDFLKNGIRISEDGKSYIGPDGKPVSVGNVEKGSDYYEAARKNMEGKRKPLAF